MVERNNITLPLVRQTTNFENNYLWTELFLSVGPFSGLVEQPVEPPGFTNFQSTLSRECDGNMTEIIRRPKSIIENVEGCGDCNVVNNKRVLMCVD